MEDTEDTDMEDTGMAAHHMADMDMDMDMGTAMAHDLAFAAQFYRIYL